MYGSDRGVRANIADGSLSKGLTIVRPEEGGDDGHGPEEDQNKGVVPRLEARAPRVLICCGAFLVSIPW